MPQTRRVVKNSTYLVLAQVPVQAANAFYVLFLAQRLGVTDFGRFATLWALLGFFQVVIEQGLGRSITRDLASRVVPFSAGVANGLVLALGLGLLSVGAMTAFGWALSAVLGHTSDFVELAFITGASLVPRAIWVTASAVLNAQQRMGWSAVLGVVASLGNVAVGLSLVIVGFGLPGVLVASAVAQVLPMLGALYLLIRVVRLGYAPISRRVLTMMARAAAPFTARAALGIVYFRADLLLLTTLVGFSAAGIYQAAYKVFELALVLPGAANLAAYPVISAYLARNRARAARAYQRLLGGMLAVGLPLSALLYMGARPLVQLLYGREYSAAAPMLAILAGAVLLSYLNAAPLTLLSALPQQATLTAVTASGLVVNLAVNAVLIPRFTGQGAALAMIASELVQCVFLFLLTARVVRGARLVRGPARLMALGFVLGAALLYGPPAIFGVALGPAWLVVVPGVIVYAVGAVRYGRSMMGELTYAAVSGVFEGWVAESSSGARL